MIWTITIASVGLISSDAQDLRKMLGTADQPCSAIFSDHRSSIWNLLVDMLAILGDNFCCDKLPYM